MGLTPTERWRAVSNVIARKGIENINVHAELARLESMVNGMDAQAMMDSPMASPQDDTGTFIPEGGLDPAEGEIMPENGSEGAEMPM